MRNYSSFHRIGFMFVLGLMFLGLFKGDYEIFLACFTLLLMGIINLIDGYIPSRDELQEIIINGDVIGNPKRGSLPVIEVVGRNILLTLNGEVTSGDITVHTCKMENGEIKSATVTKGNKTHPCLDYPNCAPQCTFEQEVK